MILLSSVVCVVFLQSANGDPYCSLNDTHIDCVPCYDNCTRRTQTCYLCPKECGKLNNCKRVCEPTCLNQTCEYVLGGSVPVCTKGCIDGRAGRQCQEYCPEGCRTCDQDTGKNCTSCLEGREGQHCNIARMSSQSTVHSASTSMRECAEDCEVCNEGHVVCEECMDWTKCLEPCDCTGLTTDSTQYPLTSTFPLDSATTEQPGSGYILKSVADSDAVTAAAVAAAVAGTVAVVAVAICITTMCMYRKMQRRPCGRERTTNYDTDRSSFTHTGYTYIDETNLGACHARLNVRPINVPRCSGNIYYEEMGSGLSHAEEDNVSESSLSAWSGTLFGNLFEVNNESDTQSLRTISEGQLNENENIDLVEVYEMNCLNYITPEVTINANHGVSDV